MDQLVSALPAGRSLKFCLVVAGETDNLSLTRQDHGVGHGGWRRSPSSLPEASLLISTVYNKGANDQMSISQTVATQNV